MMGCILSLSHADTLTLLSQSGASLGGARAAEYAYQFNDGSNWADGQMRAESVGF